MSNNKTNNKTKVFVLNDQDKPILEYSLFERIINQ